MPVEETPILLKIPDYCSRRRAKVGGFGTTRERRDDFLYENECSNQQNHQTDNHVSYDESLWDSPRITPDFGTDLSLKNENKMNMREYILNRIPRIIYTDEDMRNELETETGEIRDKMIGSGELNTKSGTYSDAENLNFDNSIVKSQCYNNDDYCSKFEECEDSDIPAPLISSAPRFRLYDMEWNEKFRPSNRISEKTYSCQTNETIVHELDEFDYFSNEEPESSIREHQILDTIGIKGLRVFRTENGEITISENGDFSFEFLNQKKLFIIKGGGCFVAIRNGKCDQLDSEKNESAEQVFHISDLKGGNLRRYVYGVRLCETIKSFVPKVRLKVRNEGIYSLMSDHPSCPSFQAEFSYFDNAYAYNIHKVIFLSGQNQLLFVPNSGAEKTDSSGVLIERSLLENFGVSEEADLEFDDPEKNKYIVEKTRQLSKFDMKWPAVLKMWRLSRMRLMECRQLELRGLEKYSYLLEGLPEYISEENNRNTSIAAWRMRKKAYEQVFPVIEERF